MCEPLWYDCGAKMFYLNAISDATAIINKQLKCVAEKAGVNKNISTHGARHTHSHFAA